jgi:hypothetical protein
MSDNLLTIRNILSKNNYEVVVELSSDSPETIQVLIPARKIIPGHDSFIVHYNPSTKPGNTGLTYRTHGKEFPDFIECPRYCLKTLVSVDIKKVCQQIEYDFSLISFVVDGQRVSEERLFDIALDFQLDSLESKKEECLNYILSSFEINDISPNIAKYANEDYLDEVYEVVRSFYGIDEE